MTARDEDDLTDIIKDALAQAVRNYDVDIFSAIRGAAEFNKSRELEAREDISDNV